MSPRVTWRFTVCNVEKIVTPSELVVEYASVLTHASYRTVSVIEGSEKPFEPLPIFVAAAQLGTERVPSKSEKRMELSVGGSKITAPTLGSAQLVADSIVCPGCALDMKKRMPPT